MSSNRRSRHSLRLASKCRSKSGKCRTMRRPAKYSAMRPPNSTRDPGDAGAGAGRVPEPGVRGVAAGRRQVQELRDRGVAGAGHPGRQRGPRLGGQRRQHQPPHHHICASTPEATCGTTCRPSSTRARTS
jgi:hypothetical protein